jgi:hypothetical protein
MYVIALTGTFFGGRTANVKFIKRKNVQIYNLKALE